MTAPARTAVDEEPGLLYHRLRRYADRRADGPAITAAEAYAIAARIGVDALRRINRVRIDRHGRRVDPVTRRPLTAAQLAKVRPVPTFVALEPEHYDYRSSDQSPAHACADWTVPPGLLDALVGTLSKSDIHLLRAIHLEGRLQVDVARERGVTEGAITHALRRAHARARDALLAAFPRDLPAAA
ncbi:hypothetical protein ASA1KI_20870 [Opitutales bacterium ASA1]|nr:hypothetical protein ASA1KI_20870 [Opitutales bacterium ASA1]